MCFYQNKYGLNFLFGRNISKVFANEKLNSRTVRYTFKVVRYFKHRRASINFYRFEKDI